MAKHSLEELTQEQYNHVRDEQERLRKSGHEDKGQLLHHLEVHADEDGTPDKPVWVVSHHFGRGIPTEEHKISSGDALLDHIAEHAHVPDEED
jgi:hypothetical protein